MRFLIPMILSQILNATPLIIAIERVESGGDPLAQNHSSHAVGPLQITPPVIADVNNAFHLKLRLEDMTDKRLSRVVFLRYMSMYAIAGRVGRPVTDRDRALIWRHGPQGWRRKTSAYWEKVQNIMTLTQ